MVIEYNISQNPIFQRRFGEERDGQDEEFYVRNIKQALHQRRY